MIYEFRCKDEECDTLFEVMRKLAQKDDPVECPECGSEDCKRVYSSFDKHISWSKWNVLG